MDVVVRVAADGRDLIIGPVGDLDMASAPAVTAVVDRELAQVRPDRLVFDLGHVTFTDSSGLAVLVGHRRVAASAGYEFVLHDVGTRTRHLLDVTRLSRYFGSE